MYTEPSSKPDEIPVNKVERDLLSTQSAAEILNSYMGTSIVTSEKPAPKLVKLEKALPFVVVVASLLLGLFLIEFPAMVRWVDYRGIVGRQREYFNTTKGDPGLLFVRRPNAHISGTSWGGNIADVAALPASDIR